MRTIKWLTCIISMMCLSVCQNSVSEMRITARSYNSSRAQLDVTVEADKMTVKLTNLTDQTVKVDRDMEIYFTFIFTEQNDEIQAKLSKGLGNQLSKRLVKLGPGESIIKVFETGDIHHYYSMDSCVEECGRSGISDNMYTYQIPDFTQLNEIIVVYNSRGSDSMIPLSLASSEGIEYPKDILDAAVTLKIKLVKNYESSLPPMFLRGDKDIKNFGESTP